MNVRAGAVVSTSPLWPLVGGQWRDTVRAVEIHYFRVPRERWELMLLRAAQSGANVVSTYVPWSHHAPAPGVVDLTGATHPRRDVATFLRLAADLGLGLIVKPGPFVDAEVIGGGVPPWLLAAHPDMWARAYDGRVLRHSDSQDARVSYDSDTYLPLVRDWYAHVAELVGPYTDGALVAVQVDNEAPGDGMLVHEADDDPSPFRGDYASPERWARWYQERYPATSTVPPQPSQWQAPVSDDELLALADADRYADQQIRRGLAGMAASLREVGVTAPLFHDLLGAPWRIGGMVVDPGVLADSCGWVGQNVYAEDVDEASLICGTSWYRMDHDEYVHHAWWRTRLCHTLSPAGLPRLVPEISARQSFYLHCHLIGGMDAPCIYMLHTSQDEPVDVGAFPRWAEEAPVLDDGTPRRHWANLRTLFLALQAGGEDLVSSPLPRSLVVAYAHGGEHLARYAGVIPGAPWRDDARRTLAEAGNATLAGVEVTRLLVEAGYDVDVVDVTRTATGDSVVVVPSLRVLQSEAFDALAAHAAAGHPVVFAGDVPDHDDHLRERHELTSLPRLTLADLDTMPLPRSVVVDTPGIDASCRVGRTAQYLTVVNRSGQPWRGSVRLASGDTVDVSCASSTVVWAAVEPGGRVTACLVDGRPGSAGDLAVEQGLGAIAHLGDAWQVITADRTDVRVPAAAGEPVWRVLLDGGIRDDGTVADDGTFHAVVEDDAGTTDRYVLGSRAAAEQAATPVQWFRSESTAVAEADLGALFASLPEATDDPDLAELRERLAGADRDGLAACLARLRSRQVGGTGTADTAHAAAELTRIGMRLRDLDLGAT